MEESVLFSFMDRKSRLKKAIFIPLGIISVVLGIIGIILPIVPTTPFLLLAAYLFYRSSEKLHDRLLKSKILGEYISSYMKHRAIKRKIKIFSIALLWMTLAISFFLIDILIVRILLVIVGAAVTTHIFRIKTLENVEPN